MAKERQAFGNTSKIGSLLERVQAGDDAARNELLEESQERLRQMASKMLCRYPQIKQRGRAETGMLFSDVWMSLARSFDDEKVAFKSAQDFLGMAATKIRRCLIDLSRKHKKEIDHAADLLPTAGGAVTGNDGTSLDDWTAFHEAVDQLPEEEKQVFTLRYYGGWSREETATIIGVAEKTITRRYGRATQLITELVNDG